MKNWKKALIALGAVSIVAGAGAAWAGHGGGHLTMMKHMVSARVEQAEDFIDATPQQRQVIDAAKDDILAKIAARMQAKQAHAGELVDLLAADKLDTDRLYRLADERAADIRELAKEIVPQIQKVHTALTPAQRQKLAQHVKEMHGHHGMGGF